MPNIDRLITEKCPEGVEFKPLCEVTNLTAGDRIIKSMMSDDAEYPVMGGGDKPTGKYTDYNFEHSATISRAGSAGSVNWLEGKFWATDVCFVASQKEDGLDIKFVYYYLCSQQPLLKTKIYGGNLPKLNKQFLWTLPIPMPAIEIQREIVRMLDSFTELEAELEAELTKRKQQYEYYMNALMLFGNNIPTKTFGEIATVSDYVANGSFASLRENVSYKRNPDYAVLLRTVDYSNGFDKDKFIYIDENAYNFLSKSKLFGGEIIINNIGAGVGTTFRCPELGMPMSLAPNAIMVTTPNDEFYYYWLQSKQGKDAINKITSKSAMPKFNKTGFRTIRVPVPSQEEQERIVNVLKKLEALCCDITEGLPAEINARHKQYEYYRDKLLTFKERVV